LQADAAGAGKQFTRQEYLAQKESSKIALALDFGRLSHKKRSHPGRDTASRCRIEGGRRENSSRDQQLQGTNATGGEQPQGRT